MTLATIITLLRIILTPIFAAFAWLYSQSFLNHSPDESLRWSAIIIFLIAAASDGLDGWIARHFHQSSKIGAMLDPLADKFLMTTALLTLSLAPWYESHENIPFWFVALVIFRDLIIVSGITILYTLKRKVPIQPSWLGKTCTVTQLFLIAWVMLKISIVPSIYPVFIASIFTLLSGILYVYQGFKIYIHALPHTKASS